jgi:hypothetical protein
MNVSSLIEQLKHGVNIILVIDLTHLVFRIVLQPTFQVVHGLLLIEVIGATDS